MIQDSLKVHALIPARGGSKGIPRKNIQMINGVPLVGLKIQQAVASKCDNVWVSTDDPEIGEISEYFGASVVMRPSEISLDTSSTESCIHHFLETQEVSDKDLVILLQPTSPLIKVSSINACIDKLQHDTEVNSTLSVRISHPFIWEQNSSWWNPVNHSRDYRPRRQDLPPQGYENGACYGFRARAFRDTGQRSPAPTETIPTNYIESIDVDTIEDLKLVEQILMTKIIF